VLEVEIGTDPQTDGRDVGMIEIGKTFYDIDPEDVQDIIDPYAAFKVGLSTQYKRRNDAVSERELHLIRIDIGVVFVTQPAIEDLSADDLS
jgi:hypothetical protein